MGGRSSKPTREQGGEANIVEALAVGLPDVFHAEILPRLELEDVLRLSRVNKSCWKAVWSEPGVRTMKAKLDSHLAEKARSRLWRSVLAMNLDFRSLQLIDRCEEQLRRTWKKCISIKMGLVVWRNKHGHPPMVKTLRRWERSGGPGVIERVLMSDWFQLSIMCTGVIAVIWLELGLLGILGFLVIWLGVLQILTPLAELFATATLDGPTTRALTS